VIEAQGKDPVHANISYIYRFDLKGKKATKNLIREGAIPPFESIERYDLQDPLNTLWKTKRESALSARCRIMLLLKAACSPNR